jgi:hypothetical protein
MQRRAYMTAALVVIAGVLILPSAGLAAPAHGDTCVTATAAAKKKSCAGCRPSLKGSAFGDTDPAAGDVGTTAGSEAVLQVKLNKGCTLPKRARMRILRQEIDFTGNAVGPITSVRCGRRSCRLPQTRNTEGGYRYQVVVVGCKRAKRSKVLTVVWAPKPTAPVPPATPSPSPSPAPAKPTMRFNQASYFNAPSDPACTAPLPGGAGAAAASYNHPQGYFNHAWRWSVPAEITEGAQVTIEVSTNSPNQGGTSASISIRTPSEFGIQPTNSQIDAVVPVGQSGADQTSQAYAFHPQRDFAVGEKLYILIGFGCATIAYEYVGV